MGVTALATAKGCTKVQVHGVAGLSMLKRICHFCGFLV